MRTILRWFRRFAPGERPLRAEDLAVHAGLHPQKSSICVGCQYTAGAPTTSEGPVWCVVANVRDFVRLGPGGILSRRGHRLFSPNTKVYLLPPRWDVRQGKFELLGLHCKSRRMIQVVLDRRYLTNWRAKLIYSPTLAEFLRANTLGYGWSKEFANAVAEHERGIETPSVGPQSADS